MIGTGNELLFGFSPECLTEFQTTKPYFFHISVQTKEIDFPILTGGSPKN